MAITKHALIRYKVLDGCFRNAGRRYFIEDLINECEKVLIELDKDFRGISLRQIRDDIAFMRSEAGWNIELGNYRDGKKMYYRYLDPSFSINNMPLNDLEIKQLASVLEILSQFKGMPQFEWINELMPKLKQGISISEKSEIIMEFDNNYYLKGIDHLGALYNSIYYKKVISIQYKPFESENPFEIILHPYYLKQYNNRWFLFGFNPENEKSDWNLAIDRIVSISEIKGKYKANTGIDWQEYFEDIIGVTRPKEGTLETIQLVISSQLAPYILTKPLHGSQKKLNQDENGLTLQIEVIPNYELEQLILSYGEGIQVKSPEYLREKIKTRLQASVDHYRQ